MCSEEEGYEYYCNIATWDEALLDENPQAEQMWNEAWVHLGPCEVASEEDEIFAVLEEEAKAATSDLDADGLPSPSEIVTSFTDCTEAACSYHISETCSMKYQVNLPEGTFSVELVHEGESWLGFAFSETGLMIGSEAVLGLPEENAVKKYYLTGKSTGSIEVMPDVQQTLMDASIEIVDGQTIMKFTKFLSENGEIAILPSGKNIMLYAHGDGLTLGYHGPQGRESFELDL